MQNPRLAARYAKALIDIAQEQKQLDAVNNDIVGIKAMVDNSKELNNLMKSPIVKADKKHAVLKQLISGKVQPSTEAFINLMVSKGREYYLPEILAAFVEQYKKLNNIVTVKLTTAHVLDDQTKSNILSKIENGLNGSKVDLQTSVQESLIGGFVLESNNKMFDASIARDLKNIKTQFLQNVYVPQLK